MSDILDELREFTRRPDAVIPVDIDTTAKLADLCYRASEEIVRLRKRSSSDKPYEHLAPWEVDALIKAGAVRLKWDISRGDCGSAVFLRNQQEGMQRVLRRLTLLLEARALRLEADGDAPQ